MKAILFCSLLFAGFTAHADTQPAENFGLQPETGYLEAVTQDLACDPAQNILMSEADNLDTHTYITKCDGSVIGWTERKINGADMTRNPDASWNVKVNFTGTPNPHTDQGYINIYTCGDSRDSDLAKDTSQVAARDEAAVDNQLQALKANESNFKVKLFYNEFSLSGKCIGKIEVVP